MTEPPTSTAGVDTSNYDKFQTGNPVVRTLIGRFFETVRGVVSGLDPATALDAGCGEGETLERLADLLPPSPVGIDLNPDSVAFAARRVPGADVQVGSLMEMPFADDAFDLVLCLEVLEHLTDPEHGVAELARVCGGDLVLSVPHEPWFRLGSLARGKYLRTAGNHPEHVNHWNHRSFRSFLERRVEVVSLTGTAPWLVAHCRPRR